MHKNRVLIILLIFVCNIPQLDVTPNFIPPIKLILSHSFHYFTHYYLDINNSS